MKIAIDISDKNRQQVAKLLQQVLADASALAALTRDAHWNIVGPEFSQLHKLFDEQYTAIDESIDGIAERMRAIGEPVKGGIHHLASLSSLKSSDQTSGKSALLLKNLLAAQEHVIRHLRAAVEETDKKGDAATSDFLTGLLADHEKMAWMLRSHLA